MQLVNNLSQIELEHSVVTIGNFDGVHRGHQKLIETLVEQSKVFKCPSFIFSFSPHPAKVLGHKEGFFKLNNHQENIKYIEELGVDYLYYENFTKEFSQKSAHTFLSELIFPILKPKMIIFGHDFKFGRLKESGLNHIKELLEKRNCLSKTVDAFKINEQIVSSSNIRKFLVEGDIKSVNSFLGRTYSLAGKVITGKKLGTQIGFPTINLKTSKEVFLNKGVYSTFVILDGIKVPAVTNVGVNPTVDDSGDLKIETHILQEFRVDIVDESIEIFFNLKIREEKKFENIDQLKAQIKKDCKESLNIWDGSL